MVTPAMSTTQTRLFLSIVYFWAKMEAQNDIAMQRAGLLRVLFIRQSSPKNTSPDSYLDSSKPHFSKQQVLQNGRQGGENA